MDDFVAFSDSSVATAQANYKRFQAMSFGTPTNNYTFTFPD